MTREAKLLSRRQEETNCLSLCSGPGTATTVLVLRLQPIKPARLPLGGHHAIAILIPLLLRSSHNAHRFWGSVATKAADRPTMAAAPPTANDTLPTSASCPAAHGRMHQPRALEGERGGGG